MQKLCTYCNKWNCFLVISAKCPPKNIYNIHHSPLKHFKVVLRSSYIRHLDSGYGPIWSTTIGKTMSLYSQHSLDHHFTIFLSLQPLHKMERSCKCFVQLNCEMILPRHQCDQIGRFIALRATIQSLWQQLICPNLLHS